MNPDRPNAGKFLVDNIEKVIETERVHQTRGPQAAETGGVQLPSIIWRYRDDDPSIAHDTVVDGITDSILRYFNIECRAATAMAAFVLSNDVLLQIESRLAEKLADYDEPDNIDQQEGGYYAHILEVGISE